MGALRYDDAVKALRAGAVINCALPSALASGDKARFEVMPGGGYVTATTFERLKPSLAVCDPSLLAEVPAQSYRWGGD